jgi:hypothetical protein
MRPSVIGLLALFLGVSNLVADSANQKLAFWNQQRKGANGDGRSAKRAWITSC